jgi:hypothetical protein
MDTAGFLQEAVDILLHGLARQNEASSSGR